eukprot:Skav228819  [mRNA]  locus=scaffold359:434950:437674:+ [translate_table: standard]
MYIDFFLSPWVKIKDQLLHQVRSETQHNEGGRPATTIQYDELMDAVGSDFMDRIFWPVVRKAYLCVRRYPGLLAEMFYTAMLRERGAATKRGDLWREARGFVARNCAATMPEDCAERFIHSLLQHCTRMERGAQVRDELKGLRLGEKTTEARNGVAPRLKAVSKAWNLAKTTTRSAGSGTRSVAGRAAEAGRGRRHRSPGDRLGGRLW